jgi:hypothetical protein
MTIVVVRRASSVALAYTNVKCVGVVRRTTGTELQHDVIALLQDTSGDSADVAEHFHLSCLRFVYCSLLIAASDSLIVASACKVARSWRS